MKAMPRFEAVMMQLSTVTLRTEFMLPSQNFKALDANEQPVQSEGVVKVTRDYWFEIWLDPQGKEVKGETIKVRVCKRAGCGQELDR